MVTAILHHCRRRRAERGRERRQGQALLIAVLLMVFAALLGSTFVTIVALNLSQTARQQDQAAARAAADAGLKFVNDQLTQHGEDWNPTRNSPARISPYNASPYPTTWIPADAATPSQSGAADFNY